LGKASPPCGYAMKWIEDNRERFKQEIIFPAAVSVQVSDPSFAHLVELACGHNLQVCSGLRPIVVTLLTPTPRMSRPLSRRTRMIIVFSISSTMNNITPLEVEVEGEDSEFESTLFPLPRKIFRLPHHIRRHGNRQVFITLNTKDHPTYSVLSLIADSNGNGRLRSRFL
jgi:hypothetical protein